MESEDREIQWRRIEKSEIHGDPENVLPDGAWRGSGEFEWQILRRRVRTQEGGPSEHFELTCFEIRNLGGHVQSFLKLAEARAAVERVEQRARSRRLSLGSSASRAVVLWPEDWEIVGSSKQFSEPWVCPECGTTLPAYEVDVGPEHSLLWICSACSMPLDWHESPDKFRLSVTDLDRLEAKDLEREWDVGVTAVGTAHFYIDTPVELPAVHTLRHVWLPPYLTTRTVFCCEEDRGGAFRWIVFVNDRERLAILVEAKGNGRAYLGYFVAFTGLGGILDLIERWDDRQGWVDQLPDPQCFWFEDGIVRDDPGIDVEAIENLLQPEGFDQA